MAGAILTLIGLCLLLSAALTAAQTAAYKVSDSRLRTLQNEGFKGADALATLRGRENDVGSSIRLITGGLNLSMLGVGVATGVLRGPPILDVIFGVVAVISLSHVICVQKYIL